MESKRFGFWAFKLCGIMIFMFVLQVLINGFTDLFVLDAEKQVEFWRFLTSVFLHGDAMHLAYNLFALVLFGSILEKLVGSRKFLIVFFATGILANIFSVNFYSSSLGASGAIFGIIGALIVVRPMLTVWAFGMPMPIFIAGVLWGVGDVIGAVGFLTGSPIDNTGNLAHLSGMFVGLIFGGFYRNWKRRRIGFKVKVDESSVRDWEDFYVKS